MFIKVIALNAEKRDNSRYCFYANIECSIIKESHNKAIKTGRLSQVLCVEQ